VAGKHSLHNETSENGKLLSQLAEGNRLIIKSTCFEHKTIHKGNWKVLNSGVVYQIDHVLVSRRHASSIIDVRLSRGPNCDSGNYLVKAVLREIGGCWKWQGAQENTVGCGEVKSTED
jgi:hypothetical protein